MDKFQAYVVRKTENQITGQIEQLTVDDLSDGEVLVEVAYSSVNYKDMLVNQIDGHITDEYPMIPGIDLSGVVLESTDERFHPGDPVIATSYQIGVTHTGGYSEYARLHSDWVLPLPESLSLKDAMIFGTAGLTAALSVDRLERASMDASDQPEIVVSGASGGVGSIALAILHHLGYQNLTAIIRKSYQEGLVRSLGASDILYAHTLTENPPRPLGHRQFDFAVDTVGGEITNQLIPIINHQGALTLCGRVGGVDLNFVVFPFISRGVQLIGIDSVNCPMPLRKHVWERIATEWNIASQLNFNEISLNELPETFEALKDGKHLGRTIVAINPDVK
ncbi:MAG: YhdH/YhfP family quinone oxidoreductase [Aerococcus sp.]|nr:YhdH/YhfP family quinone oxidoreductase [Aerococcus sp.]